MATYLDGQQTQEPVSDSHQETQPSTAHGLRALKCKVHSLTWVLATTEVVFVNYNITYTCQKLPQVSVSYISSC